MKRQKAPLASGKSLFSSFPELVYSAYSMLGHNCLVVSNRGTHTIVFQVSGMIGEDRRSLGIFFFFTNGVVEIIPKHKEWIGKRKGYKQTIKN